MEAIQFKTNIKCAACIEKVTPFLNEAVGADHWKVDIANPSKILTVDDQRNQVVVVEALLKAGYKAEPL